ncbi:MAG: 16S rRNA (guanine(966)-N(2))-methyltransferase RsmD [Acidimicrobiales bacterium]
MRVVAGTARGRQLLAPSGRDTRPTADRVREAVFNALHSRGLVEGARVLDLFAGSGALGIEALSRGAASATFVERSREALRCVRANLDATGLAERATVVDADANAFLRNGTDRFDLALLDPPYAFDGWDALLATLPAEAAVVESDRGLRTPPGWTMVRSARYGTTVVGLLARVHPASADEP